MSTTLSNGYKKPQTGDRGNTFFTDLEDNIQRVNDHSHNGTDSEKIETKNFTKGSQTISSGSWTLVSDGIYRQLVTVPSGHDVDEMIPKFLIDDDIYHPTIEKVSSTTYYIYINDNTKDVVVKYG